RRPVAVEARGQVLVRDDVRAPPARRPRLLLERPDAEDVVDVAVREDGRVERARRPPADRGVDLAGEEEAPRVDEDEPVVGVEGRDVREARDEGDAAVELLELVEREPGVMLVRPEGPRPETLGHLAHPAHPRLRRAAGTSPASPARTSCRPRASACPT